MTPTDLCVRALSMIAASLLLIFAMAPAASGARSDKPAAAGMPMGFETNHGQSAKAVRFLARHPTYTLFLTDDAAVLAALTRPESGRDSKPGTPLRGMVVTLKLAGAQPQTKIVAEGKLPGTVNYFIGNEPKLWRQGIRRHARVRYAQPWPGVDLVWQAGPGALSYRFEVAAGADPGRIAFAVPQAQKLRLDAHGGLVVTTAAGTLRHSSPRLYQLRGGRRERVDGGFALNGARQNVIGFRVGRYDRSRPLVIDPTLDFASYYGGNASESHGNQDWSGDGGLPPGLIISEMPFFDIDADASGHLFATGVTSSADFPGADAAQFNASTSAFAMRLDFTAAGPALGYATFLGGDGGDEGHGIVAAADGDAFVTGITRSYDFPTNATLPTELPALQAGLALPGAVNDAFIARLDDTGALTRATYLGGRGDDHGSAIAIDDGGGPGGAAAVVIAGSARRYSAEYSEPATPDAAQPIPAKGWEAFVAVVDPDLTALAYHSFYGGDQNDRAYGLAVRDGRAWLAGITYSTDFPVSADATQPGPGVPTDLLAGCVFESPPLLPPASCADGFVVRLDLCTGAVDYATFLGSPGFDVLRSIAVDGTGSAYVTGSADSGLIDVEHQILIAKLDGDGNEVWRHHHGGATRDAGVDAAVDGGGRLHVTGWSASAGLATPDAFQSEFADDTDAFYAIFHADGTGYSYFSYLGGSYFDYGLAIARDVNDYTYLGGVTSSGDFPLLAALHETEGESGSDLFFARFSPEVSGIPVVLSTSVDPATVAIGTAIDYWINIENPNETILDGLSLVDHLPTALAYTDVAVSTTIGIDCQYDEPAHTVTCGFVGQPPFVPPGLLPGLSSVHVTA